MPRIAIKSLLLTIIIFLYQPNPGSAYSVLTHEAIIDANWEKVIIPLLKQKFPHSSEEELKQAHAYAYGGAIVPDIGYFPFGSKLFTNLIHYVRTGDFVEALLQEAQDINEYAFALGVLCHYHADMYGHKMAINLSVPIIYTDMKKKFGDTVTFAENHIAHIRTEFSFDVLQTARGNYAPVAYHDFIGFQVARPVLERAFFKTYGLDINELFNFSRAVGTFRWIIKDLFPEITKAAWSTKKNEIQKQIPHVSRGSFIYRMRRKNYYHEFSRTKERPAFVAEVISILIRIMPSVGPFRIMHFKMPGPEAETLFTKSFDTTVIKYARRLQQLRNNDIDLSNIDFDTGNKTAITEYKLADQTYCDLLLKLRHKHFETITPVLQQNIISFYDHYQPVSPSKKEAMQWKKVKQALEQLKMMQPLNAGAEKN